MNNQDAYTFIKDYFHELFVKRNIDVLDEYLHKDYWDDDIGENGIDHIENSKSYLKNLFIKKPTIGVDVKSAMVKDEVITAYLEWFHTEKGEKIINAKGIGIFVLAENKIIKR
jgi:hypothetical protein